jgi:biopolymer transport protein TolQ
MNHALSTFLVSAPAQSGSAKTGSLSDMVQLILDSTPVIMAVMVLLFVTILGCVFIMAYKFVQLRRAQGQTQRFLKRFWESKRLDEIYQAAQELSRSPVAALFKAGYIELSKIKGAKQEEKRADETHAGDIENVERALRRASTSSITHLEAMMPFLATTGSTAPFVGLFGTVVGIMISFMQIQATGSAGMDVVAKGIYEALTTTAVGLIAAIPAVVAYNYFNRRIRVLSSEMENFSSDFLNIVKRHFL